MFSRLHAHPRQLCSVCWEPNIVGQRRCQNCRATLRRHTQRTNRSNPFNNQMNHHSFNNGAGTKESSKESKCPEILKEKVMDMYLYIKNEGGEVEAPICCICQDNIIKGQLIYKLSCSHFFHKRCASKWFKQKSECPYCRKQFIFICFNNLIYNKNY